MEPLSQKSLERIVSQRALQIGSSFPCQICVVGFLCGVCLTSLFLAALTSIGSFELGGISFSAISMGVSPGTSSSEVIRRTSILSQWKQRRLRDLQTQNDRNDDEKVSLLYSAWSAMLNEDGEYLKHLRLTGYSVPKAPHLENCKLTAQVNQRLDKRSENESFPPWAGWKGLLDMHPAATSNEQLRYSRLKAVSEGAYPPWVTGSDDENYPLTRKVQRDIWFHQHPLNCSDPGVRFLVADWDRLPGFGSGAQLAGMFGLLAISMTEKRVLVSNYYNRADHDGCLSRSSWSCYFFPETSQECRDRAFELLGSEEAWKSGIITAKENYTSEKIWTARTPKIWGDPWSYLQPTTDVNGSLLAHHHRMDLRWWRAQAVRYFMRFPTDYTCGLLNGARHVIFGKKAAKMVRKSLNNEWPKGCSAVESGGHCYRPRPFQDQKSLHCGGGKRLPPTYPRERELQIRDQGFGKGEGEDKTKMEIADPPSSGIEEYVWSSHKPWVPRLLLSMHVRMGDKSCEMKVVEFEEYVHLAQRLRKRFPQLNSVWLSTEMQEVIDKSKSYSDWNFYHTNVTRQEGNMSMANYEASLGREISTNNALVNFLLAAEADFFIGALGSTWCFLIDGMRNTGGKVMAGYLSVNKDRFW
ncbi:hypothetical protein CJ030_MR7G012992 [Morella rubra]|uniref:Alpha-(1,6)-fucosyltransferase n=1 Tax=Morella rubra TaxID=262757 RepID=A0A6A1V648_9ROSI|nr:hypothetical protein CJ030_MR7G012992 [Morella rubra]